MKQTKNTLIVQVKFTLDGLKAEQTETGIMAPDNPDLQTRLDQDDSFAMESAFNVLCFGLTSAISAMEQLGIASSEELVERAIEQIKYICETGGDVSLKPDHPGGLLG